MQSSKVVIVFKVFIVLLFLWATTFLLYFSVPKPKTVSVDVPSEFDQVIVIQPTDAVLDAFKQLTTDENYQYLYRKIVSTLEKQKDKPTEKNIGINLLEPFILVTASENQNLILSLSNEKDFVKFAKKSNLNYKIKDKKAFVTISGNVLVPTQFKAITVETKDFLSVIHPTNKRWTLEIHDNVVSFAGEMSNIQMINNQHLSKIPQTKGVFLQFPFPSGLLAENDRLKNVPNEWKSFLENISSIAVDYQGISASSNGMSPILNSVISFREHLDISLLSEQLEMIKEIDFQEIKTDVYQLTFAGSIYILKKINENEWFFGLDETLLMDNSVKNLIVFQGKPMYFTEVKGGLLATAVLNFIPGFKPTKNLLNKTENADIRIFYNGKNVEIKGNLTFKESENVLLDLLAFGIDVSEL